MFFQSLKRIDAEGASSTLSAKWKKSVGPSLRAGTALQKLQLLHLVAACYKRRFPSGAPAMSSVPNLMYRRCLSWHIFQVYIITETILCRVISRISSCECSVLVLSSSLAYGKYDPCSHCLTGWRFRSQGACGVLFSMPSR